MSVAENQELMALKNLLNSWQVGVLFDLFKEEDITINELKMMEYSHIHSLLKDYKTGIKIRFEYNLKNWRQKLGIPLKLCETNKQNICCCIKRENFENNITENHYAENHHAENLQIEYNHAENQYAENHYIENNHAENHHVENEHAENHHVEHNHAENYHVEHNHAENHHVENNHSENHHTEENHQAEQITTSPSVHYNNDAKMKRSEVGLMVVKKERMDESQVAVSPQSVYSNNSLLNILNTDDVFNFGTIQPATVKDKTHNIPNEMDVVNVPLQALGELLSDSDNVPPKFPSKSNPEKYSINLKRILKNSGSRAAAILNYYQEKNRLTNVFRAQLIQLIVDFFIDNDYHLSLNLSHNLEWEIIKMFPTEKLEYYRTEKRGKIYAKFSNMKRYKRERSLKSITEAEILYRSTLRFQQKTDEDETNNFVQENDDSWYPTAEPEIVVKEENGEENA